MESFYYCGSNQGCNVGVSVDREQNSIYPKGYLRTKNSAVGGKYEINDQYIGEIND